MLTLLTLLTYFTYLLYLLTYFTYLLTRFKTVFWEEVHTLEKRETVNRQPSTVNRQPLTEVLSCRAVDGGWRIFRDRC